VTFTRGTAKSTEHAHPRSTRRNEAEAAANHAVNWELGVGIDELSSASEESIERTSTQRSQACKRLARECALDVTANSGQAHVTIEFSRNVETHKTDNDADKGKHPCDDIHDERPSPWPPPGVDLPLEIEGSNEFPSIPDISGGNLDDVRESSQVNTSADVHDFDHMAFFGRRGGENDSVDAARKKKVWHKPSISNAYTADASIV
jgi:hypothetical protein